MGEMRHRPMGDIVVALQPPVARWGMAVLFGVRAGDGIKLARVMDTGDLTYDVEDKPGTASAPTLMLDDYELEALRKAVNDMPARFQGAGHLNHLADVQKQRDELMEMVKVGQLQYHELAMSNRSEP